MSNFLNPIPNSSPNPEQIINKIGTSEYAAFFVNDSQSCNASEVLSIKPQSAYQNSLPTQLYIVSVSIIIIAVITMVIGYRKRLINTFQMKKKNTILVIGASQTGKKSIITNFKNINPISQSWNFLVKDYTNYKIPKDSHPDVIWIVINSQALIDDNEFQILKSSNQIPVVIIINKVDFLQEYSTFDDQILANFNEQPADFLQSNKRLINIRNRLIKYNKPMIILSLRQEEDFDRIIGIKNLIKFTNQQFTNHLQSKKRILLMGYTSTGKSSLINAFAGQNLASISLDGQPMTKQIEEYFLSNENLVLIDSIGFEKKRDNTEKFQQLKTYYQPDFIWFLVNYHSSIDNSELNIVNKLFPTIPTIIIVNFTDILQNFNDEIDFNNEILSTNQSFKKIKQSLLQFKANHSTTIQDIVVISLRTEEKNDRPRGLQILLDKTIKYFQ